MPCSFSGSPSNCGPYDMPRHMILWNSSFAGVPLLDVRMQRDIHSRYYLVRERILLLCRSVCSRSLLAFSAPHHSWRARRGLADCRRPCRAKCVQKRRRAVPASAQRGMCRYPARTRCGPLAAHLDRPFTGKASHLDYCGNRERAQPGTDRIVPVSILWIAYPACTTGWLMPSTKPEMIDDLRIFNVMQYRAAWTSPWQCWLFLGR